MSAVTPSTTTVAPVVTAEGTVGSDAAQLAASGAQIAASVVTSNPVGIAIGSIDALNSLIALIGNLNTLMKSGALTQAQVDQILSTLGLQTSQSDLAWQKITGSPAV